MVESHVARGLVGLLSKGVPQLRFLKVPVIALLLPAEKRDHCVVIASQIAQSSGAEREPVNDFADRQVFVRTALRFQREQEAGEQQVCVRAVGDLVEIETA